MIKKGRTNQAPGKSRSLALAGFLLMQSVAALFFVGDAIQDLVAMPLDGHSLVEALIAVVLIIGVFVTGWLLRSTLEQVAAQQRALDVASGDLMRVVESQFENWGLTAAEKDVGFLALKGIDIADIARIRGAASGTVRAQLTRIYAKAGVSGRPQFAAWFVEDLLSGASDIEK